MNFHIHIVLIVTGFSVLGIRTNDIVPRLGGALVVTESSQTKTNRNQSAASVFSCLWLPFVCNDVDPERDVTFHLYTKRYPDLPFRLRTGDRGSLDRSSFNPEHSVVFMIHGFSQNFEESAAQEIRKAYMRHDESINLILIDWERMAAGTFFDFLCYGNAVYNTKGAGIQTAAFIQFLAQERVTDLTKVHVLGHGLGAHVAAVAGHILGGNLNRITGLDPAGVCFETGKPKEDRLDDEDARFVDVVHTTAGGHHGDDLRPAEEGHKDPMGDTDYYPNDGRRGQPGCSTGACSHERAVAYYAESLRDPLGFLECRCRVWEDCHSDYDCDDIQPLGYYASRIVGSAGNYFGQVTQSESPFGHGVDCREEVRKDGRIPYFVRYMEAFTLYVALFNLARRYSPLTVSVRDRINHPGEGHIVDRPSYWPAPKELGCIGRAQQIHPNFRDNFVSSEIAPGFLYQKGHLQPANSFRFSPLAVKSTFHPLNLVPQHPSINGGAWRDVERIVHESTLHRPGYVITGVSERFIELTKGGIAVPACQWTLYCFKVGDRVYVNGYYAGNSPYDAQQRCRHSGLVNQAEIKLVGGWTEDIDFMWRTATPLKEGRYVDFNPDDCIGVLATFPLRTPGQSTLEYEGVCETTRWDETRHEFTTGIDIAYTVTRLISKSKIFPSDTRFLYRLAFVESNFGDRLCRNAYTEGGYSGGIWCINEAWYLQTVHVDEDSVLNQVHARVYLEFGIRWEETKWSDLNKPFYSGLAAYMWLYEQYNKYEATIRGQALQWFSAYQHKGLDMEYYVSQVEELERLNSGCRGQFDMILAMDGSGSISDEDYKQQKQAVHVLFENYGTYPSGVELALIVFSDVSDTQFPLRSGLSPEQIRSRVESAPHPKGWTNTYLAIDAIRTMFADTLRSSRPAIQIILTDGLSNDPAATVRAAVQSRNAGVVSYAIGVGESYDFDELLTIAGTSTQVFTVEDFGALLELRYWLNAEACSVPQKGQSNWTVRDEVRVGESRYFSFQVPPEGFTIEVRIIDVDEGAVSVTYSYTFDNPSPVFNDGIIHGMTHIRHPSKVVGKARSNSSESEDTTVFVAVQGRGYDSRNAYELKTELGKIDGCGLLGTSATHFEIGEIPSNASAHTFIWEYPVYYLDRLPATAAANVKNENRNSKYIEIHVASTLKFYTSPRFSEYMQDVGLPILVIDVVFYCSNNVRKEYQFDLRVVPAP